MRSPASPSDAQSLFGSLSAIWTASEYLSKSTSHERAARMGGHACGAPTDASAEREMLFG